MPRWHVARRVSVRSQRRTGPTPQLRYPAPRGAALRLCHAEQPVEFRGRNAVGGADSNDAAWELSAFRQLVGVCTRQSPTRRPHCLPLNNRTRATRPGRLRREALPYEKARPPISPALGALRELGGSSLRRAPAHQREIEWDTPRGHQFEMASTQLTVPGSQTSPPLRTSPTLLNGRRLRAQEINLMNAKNFRSCRIADIRPEVCGWGFANPACGHRVRPTAQGLLDDDAI